MIRCYACGGEWPLSEAPERFTRNRSTRTGFQGSCRACERAHRVRNKERLAAVTPANCQRCGEPLAGRKHEWHHTEPPTRDTAGRRRAIKGMMAGNWARIERELEKCIAVHKECHREIHRELRNAA